jgi:26S proteasome regulatory subunit N1
MVFTFFFQFRCVPLLIPPDDLMFMRTVHEIYIQHNRLPEALALAIRLGDPALIREDFNAPVNPYVYPPLLTALCPTAQPSQSPVS